MSIWNATTTTVTSSLSAVTTTALAVDKLAMSGYHAADVLETNAAGWAINAKAEQAERQALSLKRRAMALAEADDKHAEALTKNKRLEALYQQHYAKLSGEPAMKNVA